MPRASSVGESVNSGSVGESVVGSRVTGDMLGSFVRGLRVIGDKEGRLEVGSYEGAGLDGSELWAFVGSNVNEGLELGTDE